MLSKPEPACLVIADIAGYTGYLAGAELDHAQDVLADLMDTVVTSLRPMFRLAKLEGDAAFCYVATETVDRTVLQDTIEGCYFAFRRRLRDIGNASSCECNACILIPALDLKFTAHHGTVAFQRIAGWEELVGSDVIVVHRLLKNHVEEAVGITAYALYTQAVIDAMGITDPAAGGLVRHAETYEAIGEVVGWVRDLEAAWRDEQERTTVVIEAEDALGVIALELPGPPAIVWEWVTSPIRRPQWQHGVTDVVVEGVDERQAVGTTNHCIHGKDATIEEILDWRPFEYMTDRSRLPQRGIPELTTTLAFVPIDSGTRVEYRVAKPRSLKDRTILRAVLPMIRDSIEKGAATLTTLISDDLAARAAAAAGGPAEPSVPTSPGRHLADPLPGPISYLPDEDGTTVDSGVAHSS
jgi:hypothetical protein